ncbi:uncharacterized protein LOC120340743 isoform X2 [Styela clava]
MSSLGDIARPTSRVLRPPGGGSSNIFGETDNSSTKKSPNAKPTYQSSVFSSGLEPEKPKSATRPDRMSSNIFGTDNNDNQTSTNAKKVSKTHQSSLFQEPEPLSEEKKKAAMKNNISNIPMFNANSPEEAKSPIRRPVTAPTHMPQGSSLNLFSTMNHATDNKPGPGEKTITRTVYSRRSTSSIFSLNTDVESDVSPSFRRKFGRHLRSSIFQPPEEVTATISKVRRNPITGEGIEIPQIVRGRRPAFCQSGNGVELHKPRLGPVKNVTGMRCYKLHSAGGRSTFGGCETSPRP